MLFEPAVHLYTRQIWIAARYIYGFVRVDGKWYI